MVFGFRTGGKGKIDVSLQVDRPEGPFYSGDAVHADIVLEVEKGTPVRGFTVEQEVFVYNGPARA